MYEMDRMCEVVSEELMKIADKGLNTSNLETAYKLVDMYKDLKTVEAMEGGSYGYDDYEPRSGRAYGMETRKPAKTIESRWDGERYGHDYDDRYDDRKKERYRGNFVSM